MDENQRYLKPVTPTFNSAESRRRYKHPNKVKFDDHLKEIFLNDLSFHGKPVLACKAVDIHATTYREHYKNDPDFAQAVDEAIETLNAERASQIEQEALSGAVRQTFNGKGELVGEQRVYETKLREMILKRSDPAYRETSNLDVNVKGGCLVLPAVVSLDDWEQNYSPIIVEKQRQQLEEGTKESDEIE